MHRRRAQGTTGLGVEDGEIVERAAGAAVLLGDGEPEYTRVGQRLPQRRGAAVGAGFIQRAHQTHGALRGQQRAQCRGELALLSGGYRFHLFSARFPSASIGGHSVPALGDDVAQDLVGTSTEAHQGGGPVEPLEFAGQGRLLAAMRQQGVRAE